MDPRGLVVDASTLLNFLRVRRFDLLFGLGYRVRIVDAVYDEIQSERDQLDELLYYDQIRLITLEGVAITHTAAKCLAVGLGNGESFSLAAAVEFQYSLAIDDIRAVKKIRMIASSLTTITSVDVIVAGVRAGRLTLEEADAIKDLWATEHRFRLKINTFRELIPEG